jgi:hypothetical protein
MPFGGFLLIGAFAAFLKLILRYLDEKGHTEDAAENMEFMPEDRAKRFLRTRSLLDPVAPAPEEKKQEKEQESPQKKQKEERQEETETSEGLPPFDELRAKPLPARGSAAIPTLTELLEVPVLPPRPRAELPQDTVRLSIADIDEAIAEIKIKFAGEEDAP